MYKYWNEIEELINRTLVLEPAERISYLKETCSGNQEMLEEAIDYLSFIEKAERENYLDNSLASSDTFGKEMSGLLAGQDELRHIIGKKVGPYEIKKLLGEGGMGSVYLAERVDGDFEQKAAIKFLRGGFFSPYLRERFRREKNALSRLQHPNIARLLDGGITPEGSPYFIMEYVEGTPIHRYCDEHKLSINNRLDLFMQVCEAVQHAHSKLVIHRDLKPENILVTAGGQVKVMDFGIAKLLSTDGETDPDAPDITRQGHVVASFDIAAPEQLASGESTVRTDVYGLGALLYLLVTGNTLFRFTGRESLQQAEKIVRETEPSRPSESEDPSAGSISRDLDAIILKAVRKQADDRYASVTHFREDLHRYRHKLPVEARKGTLRYRAGRFIRRNAYPLAGAAALLIAISGFTFYHVDRLTQERNLANAEAEKVRQIRDLMIDIFSANDPRSASFATIDLTVSQALSMGINRVTENFSENPEVNLELLSAIGATLTNVEDYENAFTAYMYALDQTEQQFGRNSPEYSVALTSMADLMSKSDSLNRALEYADESIVVLEEADDATTLDVANRYGTKGYIQGRMGQFEDARATLETADSLYRADGYDQTLGYYRNLSNLADLYTAMRNFEAAEEALLTSTQYYESIYDGMHDDIVTNTSKLGNLYLRMSQNKKAEEYLLRALELRKQYYGENSTSTATTHSYLFSNYRVLDEPEKALYHATRYAEINLSIHGEESVYYSHALNQTGLARKEAGDIAGAERDFMESIRIKKEILPANSTYLGVTYYNMGDLLHGTGDYLRALDYFERVLEIDMENYGADHPEIALDLTKIGVVQRDMEQFDEALETFGRAGEIYEAKYPETHYRKGQYHMEVGKLYAMKEQNADALEHFNAALAINRSNFDETHSAVVEAREWAERMGDGR
ncbi:serine/threonine-protein kinase [Rhodohalobacter mucosus]|uniref:Protein kinase domain-containing protein n=1 Tax=Rhodohalobacter mucosus TaxID=2079485 RepID=A0A316TLI3_9BACT|nr:serine/threonine-protein kinase [Rhodohalobacter mucosus]PWN05443.1 hypothetical protein DDZ15_15370 [Rhodohalobacter mucosus]